MPHKDETPEDEQPEVLTKEEIETRGFKTVLAARRKRDPEGPTFAEDVQRVLDQIEKRGGDIRQIQEAKRAEAEKGRVQPDIFRFATASEITLTSQGLARRLKGGDTPTEADLNAALVMIMDAEDQRRILFEQQTGVRTPDPLTEISSLDDPNALANLARSTGVGADVPRPGILGNIRAFFDLP